MSPIFTKYFFVLTHLIGILGFVMWFVGFLSWKWFSLFSVYVLKVGVSYIASVIIMAFLQVKFVQIEEQ